MEDNKNLNDESVLVKIAGRDQAYCMDAAERHIGALLGDDGGGVLRTASNQIVSFAGISADKRGNFLLEQGIAISKISLGTDWDRDGEKVFTIDKSQIQNLHNIAKQHAQDDSYPDNDVRLNAVAAELGQARKANESAAISLAAGGGDKIKSMFEISINNRSGYHFYYVSMATGFHTMVLAVDFRNPCLLRYKLYDQGGVADEGDFQNFAEDLRKILGHYCLWSHTNKLYKAISKQSLSNNNIFYGGTIKFWKITR